MRRLEMTFRVTDFPDRSLPDHFVRSPPPRLESELVVYQSKDAGIPRGVGHFARLGCVHRHRLLAQDVFAVLDCRKRHFVMELRRRRDADKIDIIAPDSLTPVIGEVTDPKFLSRRLRILDARTRDRNDLRIFTRLKSRYLNLTREACTDDPDPNLGHICKVRTRDVELKAKIVLPANYAKGRE
jgi:hypothetical protein